MLQLEFKILLKNLGILIWTILLSVAFIGTTIYFLYLKITFQLDGILKNASLSILVFPNFLVSFCLLFYWNLRSYNNIHNKEYYLFNITIKDSLKGDLKQIASYFLILLPLFLFFLVIELIIYATPQNFSYAFIYYFVFYWITIFLLLKFIRFLHKKNNEKLANFYNTLLFFITIGTSSWLVGSIVPGNLVENQSNINFSFYYLLFIFNPNLISIIFLTEVYNYASITSAVLVSVIILFILFIVIFRSWFSDKKLLIFNDIKNLLVAIDSDSINYSRKKIILNRVNFSIYQGEHIGLLGRNGSGKTTLVKVLTKSLLSKKTKLFWKQDPFVITGVFQEFRFDDGFKCFEIIKYYSYLYHNKFTNDQINHFFKEFELEEYKDKFYKDLSYGTKQKIKIIFALINKPDLLIMDEPFLGVDLVWKKLCMAKIKELFLNKPETALIFISHVLQDHKELTNKYFLVADKTVTKIKSIDEYVNSSKALYKKFKL